MMRLILLLVLIIAFAAAAYAQSAQAKPNPAPSDPTLKDSSKDGSKDDTRFGSPEAEMRSKLEIKEEKKKYDEHVARAKEVSELASKMWESYQEHKAFSTDDQKRCERLEKLTKRIRNDAGGENKNDYDLKDVPAGVDSTVKKISEMADELQKLVENTPRNVVSAAVIDQANQLLGLIQLVRTK
ncbi:MAG TPA: hypothetical protein VE961_19620 [Pyrinomonadaceae bacterium]|nr:hypothetical protein [Pyrinomonadaceae bacterium]